MIPLDELRAIPALAYMPLLRRGQRLSVQPVTEQEWKRIVALSRSQTAW
jgi:predicted RNA-binding protein with PUA-like domain